MITHEMLRELLTIKRLESYLQDLPAGSPVGIAEDEDPVLGSDWAHKNVIARYLAAQLSIPLSLITVDYSGITIIGECEELLYDGSLAWVEYLLMALDAMLAGTHSFQNVSKKQVLAFLTVFTVLENTRRYCTQQETSKEEKVNKGLNAECLAQYEDEQRSKASPQKDTLLLPYAYMASLTTHQMVYQDVIVESETALSEDEIIEKALTLAGDEWKPGPVDEGADVDEVQTLRTKPEEQKGPFDGGSSSTETGCRCS